MTSRIRKPLTHLVLAGILLSSTALLAGCNTAEGVGQDMRAGGRAIERSVK